MCTPSPFPVGLSSLLQMCENTCEDCGRQFNDTATCRCEVCIQIAQIFHLWRSSNLNDGYFQVVQVDILRRLHVLIDLVHQSSTTRCAEPEDQEEKEEEEPLDQGSSRSRSRSRSRSKRRADQEEQGR